MAKKCRTRKLLSNLKGLKVRNVVPAELGWVVVDLERSELVDLLPTRSAKVLGEWLAQRPEVKVVSRDRQGVYAEGVRAGAPKARQVADRFHLTLNFRQAVERELALRRSFLRFTPQSTPVVPSGGGRETENKGRQISIQSSVQQQHAEVARLRRQQKLELFQTIQRMKSAGMKVSQIARHLGINRRRIAPRRIVAHELRASGDA